MPSQHFEQTARAASPPDEVWEALQRPDTWATIGGVDRIFDPVHDGDGILTGYGFEATAGGRTYPGQARTTVAEPPHRMVMHVETAEVDGRIGVSLDPDGAGTLVAVDLMVRSRGPLSTLLFPVVARAIGSGFAGSVADFAARL